MAIIRGISIDMDGCFLGTSFLQNAEANVIAANQFLLDQILAENERYEHTRLFIGSNRQSVFDDRTNGYKNQNGSAYPRFLELAAYLGATPDKFLLAGLYNDLPDEDAFNQAYAHLDERHYYDIEKCGNTSFPEWLHDNSKVSILYAQMHKMATEFPQDKIDFYFYDDRADILDNLHAYFAKYPKLIPKNLGLHCVHYEGQLDNELKPIPAEKLTQPYPSIKRQGKIDYDFRNTVKMMAAQCIESDAFQAKEPSNDRGRRVRTYAQALESKFMLTSPINCLDFDPKHLLKPSSGSGLSFFKKLSLGSKKDKREASMPNLSIVALSKKREESLPELSTPVVNKELPLISAPVPNRQTAITWPLDLQQPEVIEDSGNQPLRLANHRNKEMVPEEDEEIISLLSPNQ